MPHINDATGALDSAYKGVQDDVANVTSRLGQTFDAYNPSNPNLTAANGYVGDVLGGRYLTGNPHLQGIIDTTNNSVMDRVNALFSRSGQTGSSRQMGELGARLAEAENGLRYQDYNAERDRMGQAVGQAAGLNEAENSNIQTQAALGTAMVGLPMDIASQYAAGQAGLWGNLIDNKKKASGSLLDNIGQAVSIGSKAASLFSDRRLKTNIRKVGEFADGLGRYVWTYVWGGPEQEGVMADEVARLRPWALGPEIGGYATVNYGAL